MRVLGTVAALAAAAALGGCATTSAPAKDKPAESAKAKTLPKGLDASVKVWGPYTNNLGNGDEINLFDGAGGLVDRLTYGSDPRTRGVSGRATSADALGANDVSQWVFSSVGDIEGSWANSLGDIGSPGRTSFASPVPEPESYAMLLAGLGAVAGLVRRRRKTGLAATPAA